MLTCDVSIVQLSLFHNCMVSVRKDLIISTDRKRAEENYTGKRHKGKKGETKTPEGEKESETTKD